MKKTIPAFIAALLITATVGTGMYLIGKDALGTSTAQAQAAAATIPASGDAAQYQQLIAQYQAREAQYQDQLKQAADQITAANQRIQSAGQQIQQYQSLLSQLQNSGLITVASDGTVTINQANQSGFPFFGDRHGDGH